VTLPWPEMPSTSRPGESVRLLLDYVCWAVQELQQLGAVPTAEIGAWRPRVGRAFAALVNPMIAGYGDPYPPDVPPARSPGTWPDVAAADIPGMTVRHQLVVLGMLAEQSRNGVGLRARPELLAELEARIGRARAALDLGPSRPMPIQARSKASAEKLQAAAAEEKAIREHTRRRSRQVRDLLKKRGRSKARPSRGKPTAAKGKRGGKQKRK
jgi:hypothetical protein